MIERVPDDTGVAAGALVRWQRMGNPAAAGGRDEIRAARIALCIAHTGKARQARARMALALSQGAAEAGTALDPSALQLLESEGEEHEDAAYDAVGEQTGDGVLWVPRWLILGCRSLGDHLPVRGGERLAWESMKASLLLVTEALLLSMFDSATGQRTTPSWTGRHHPACERAALEAAGADRNGGLAAALEDARQLEADTARVREIAIASLTSPTRTAIALRKEIGERLTAARYPRLEEWVERQGPASAIHVIARRLCWGARSGWGSAARRGRLDALQSRVTGAALCASAAAGLLESLAATDTGDDAVTCKCAIAAPGHHIAALVAAGAMADGAP